MRPIVQFIDTTILFCIAECDNTMQREGIKLYTIKYNYVKAYSYELRVKVIK